MVKEPRKATCSVHEATESAIATATLSALELTHSYTLRGVPLSASVVVPDGCRAGYGGAARLFVRRVHRVMSEWEGPRRVRCGAAWSPPCVDSRDPASRRSRFFCWAVVHRNRLEYDSHDGNNRRRSTACRSVVCCMVGGCSAKVDYSGNGNSDAHHGHDNLRAARYGGYYGRSLARTVEGSHRTENIFSKNR